MTAPAAPGPALVAPEGWRLHPAHDPWTLQETVKQIPLTRGLFALVDAEDFEWLSQWTWHATKTRRTTYAMRWLPAPARSGIYMHRQILNAPAWLEGDHIDGNGLRNTRDNLRLASREQNMANSRRRRDNSAGFKGVTWHPVSGMWRVRVDVNGTTLQIGYFREKEEAGRAYDAAARRIFGEFARLNFPDEASSELRLPSGLERAMKRSQSTNEQDSPDRPKQPRCPHCHVFVSYSAQVLLKRDRTTSAVARLAAEHRCRA